MSTGYKQWHLCTEPDSHFYSLRSTIYYPKRWFFRTYFVKSPWSTKNMSSRNTIREFIFQWSCVWKEASHQKTIFEFVGLLVVWWWCMHVFFDTAKIMNANILRKESRRVVCMSQMFTHKCRLELIGAVQIEVTVPRNYTHKDTWKSDRVWPGVKFK